ncbi:MULTISPECIES: hypothetical protein [unclassified Paraflavitalea]|uniref:hypothetical protein n=1 Tax=unclassified Paraflavitalea TaxID=2798305 RepID=UPI003D335B24
MSGINVCATLGGNTGKGQCDVRMAAPAFIMPTKGKTFSGADLASSDAFKAALLIAMLAIRTSSSKVFLFPKARVVEDNTADPTFGNLSDGYEELLNETAPGYTLQSVVGVCLQQAMCKFNGWADKVFIIDKNNILWYIENADKSGTGFSVGSLFTPAPRFGNTANVATVNTRLVFGAVDEFKGGIGALKLDFDVTKLTNTVDVVLSEKQAAVANVLKIQGLVACTGVNIYSAYKAGLGNIARWYAKRLDTGAALTITSVSGDDALESFTFTLDSTQHTALPSATKVEIGLVDPATLNTAGVSGIEGVSFVYTKP